MKYELLQKKINADDTKNINKLLRQLSSMPKNITEDELRHICGQECMNLMVARDESRSSEPIIGMASVIFYNITTGSKAIIEDVVVDASYRNRGIGKTLVKKLIEIAKNKNIAYIDLTSNPTRIAANNLYRRLGFIQRTTNVYRLELQ